MKKLFTLVAICLTLAVATAFAETQKSEIGAVNTEQSDHYDALLSVGCPMFYVAVANGEVVPELHPTEVGNVSEGFKGSVFRPPLNIYS